MQISNRLPSVIRSAEGNQGMESSARGIKIRLYRCQLGGIAESKLAQVQQVGEDAVVGKVEGGDFAG